jgi:fido (protein-threonine AMPylation protein)
MAYSDFKLSEVIQKFGLKINEQSGLFANVQEEDYSDLLATILRENVDLAVSINTEKARSEMIISPILLEIRRKLNYEISFFSGVDFNVDSQNGLNGFCDFLISLSKEQLFIRAPIITLVEAKNENLKSGLAQCIAEMVAAHLFNEQQGNSIKIIYGAVTIGTIWQFLKLEEKVVSIDLSEYYIRDVKKILGILLSAIKQS